MVGFSKMLEAVRKRVQEVDAASLRVELETAGALALVLVDVREGEEVAAGMLPGAHHLPRGLLELRAESLWPTTARIVCYCAAGTRSALAADTLSQLGYSDVRSLRGGVAAWRAQGGALEPAPSLTPAQAQRYSRHVSLAEVGVRGQARLCASSVLVVGLGAVGSAAAAYLAAAGVGRLGLCDERALGAEGDAGLLHAAANPALGRAASAAVTLGALNPEVQAEVHAPRDDAAWVALARAHDLVFFADASLDASTQESLLRRAARASVVARCTPSAMGFVVARAAGVSSPCAHVAERQSRGHGPPTPTAPTPTAPMPTAPTAAALLGAHGASLAVVRLLGLAQAPASWTAHDGTAGSFRDMLASDASYAAGAQSTRSDRAECTECASAHADSERRVSHNLQGGAL